MPRPIVGQTFNVDDRVMKEPANGSSGANPSFGTRYGVITECLLKRHKNGARHHYYKVLWDTKQRGEHAQHVLAAIPPDSPHYQPST